MRRLNRNLNRNQVVAGISAVALLAGLLPAAASYLSDPGSAADAANANPADIGGASGLAGAGNGLAARQAEPVVLTGDLLPGWASGAATGTPKNWPSGTEVGDNVRSAHNGTIVTPPDTGTGIDVDRVVAYRWEGRWVEVPVQVDERFPYFLANAHADFGIYSGTDTELTYAWGPSATTVGEEAWKKVAGSCTARYAASTDEQTDSLVKAGTLSAAEAALDDYTGPMADPVPGLDADDEVAFMASDAGAQAPVTTAGPFDTTGRERQEIRLVDPLDPDTVRYVYLFEAAAGTTSSFDHTNGYVDFARDADADQWVDERTWSPSDPEKLASSNRGYGPNLHGTVCDDDGTTRTSNDRFPRDGVVVTTDGYRFTATGRWMTRDVQVAAPGQDAKPAGTPNGERTTAYGPDLVDRWKGRAFQQSPDSAVSLVGFEDEQVNWEANTAQLGWRVGPVRAIRETWGADSGTNVTKTETFYRDVIQHRFRVRVHPIPADGLYTSWDYNAGVAQTYYNELNPQGVAIDGINDDVFNVDEVPLAGTPFFIDVSDPSFDLPSALYRWEQIAGRDDTGSLIYTFEMMGATTVANGDVVPYYRDDRCLDDGTGDDPVARPWPGEASTDTRVEQGYAAAAGLDYAAGERADCNALQTQGAFASHGLHFFFAPESDNLFVGTPTAVNEIDGRQWQFAVPMTQPHNVGPAYGNVVRAPLVATATPQPNAPAVTPDGTAEIAPGQLLAGAAMLDSTWNIGASSGQYAGEEPGYVQLNHKDGAGDENSVDPYTHSPTSKASYGLQGQESVRALVVRGADGDRFALVANDLYIPQDILTRRVGQLLEEHDRLVATGAVEGVPTGITAESLVMSVSHSHSSPFYSSTTWGPWAFEDVYDIRYFEHIARRMSEAVIAAASDLKPVRMGASQSDFRLLKRHSFGPTVGDDGLPAGYPEIDVDGDLTVLAFDDISDPAQPKALATWVVWGLHPEMTDDEDLLTSEWVQTMYRYTDREIGGVTLFSQRDTGTAEVAKDGKAHVPQLRQEFDHHGYAQVDYAGRLISRAVEMNRAAITTGADAVAPVTLRDGTTLPKPHEIIDWRATGEVSMKDLRFAPPGARPSQTVSNCRTEKVFDGNPGIPVIGLPDCEFVLGDAFGKDLFDQLERNGADLNAVYDSLREAGIPVPDNYGFPSVGSLQESATVHLQAIRLGDIAITVCPCEQWADQTRNIESRLDDVEGNLWYGFDWTANPLFHPSFVQGVIYDGQSLPGHGPLTLPDANGEHWCHQNADTTWTCRNPNWHRNFGLPEPASDAGKWLAPVSDDAFMRLKAQIYNDAAGWDDLANSATAEYEPTDNADVWGNFTHEELFDATGGGYALVVPLAMSNDYMGYIASYREYQSHDHYRKALTGLGPHSEDFLATRLTRMAAELKGAPAVELTAKDVAYQAEDARTEATAQAIGEVARVVLRAYEAATPADGGTPTVTAQPANTERFGMTSVSWVGGSTFTDSPDVVVQRLDESGRWVDYADRQGEVQLIPDFPDVADADMALWAAGQYAWTWTATFEAYSSPFAQPDAQGVSRIQTPAGFYRFVIAGCRRGAPMGPNPTLGVDGCESADPTGRVTPYTLTSEPFEVTPFVGLTVEDLQVDRLDISFAVGPAPAFPPSQSNTDDTFSYGTLAPVDYPDSYASPFDYIRNQSETRAYAAGPADDERFCWYCTFRPWADTGGVADATVTIVRARGGVETFTAAYNPATGRLELTLAPKDQLQSGDTVQVRPGALLDVVYGETNAVGVSRTWTRVTGPPTQNLTGGLLG